MPTTPWTDLERKLFTPEDIAAVHADVDLEILEMNIQAIRELVGSLPGADAADAALRASAAARDDQEPPNRLSVLRRYVEALGGELEVVARFDDKTVTLRGV